MKTALALLLLAVPLSGQQTSVTVVPDVQVTVNGDTIVVNVEVMSDSVRLSRIAEAVEGLARAITECGCGEQPTTSTVVRIGQGALVLAAFFIGFQVKRVADGYAPSDSNGDSDPSTSDYPESD